MLKLSVLVLTHNHEAFLAQALDSVLMQQTTFAYEIVVGEDGSTDQTRAVVEAYHRCHPDRIQPIYQACNAGVGPNLRACFAACRGQYLALLEGDDYWTNPHKLQMQVDWLEAHSDYTMCYHDLVSLWAPPGEAPRLTPFDRRAGERTEIHLADFLQSPPTHVSTVMLRQVYAELPNWLFGVYPIDLPLLLLYAAQGKVRRLPGVQSVYRVHAGGSWSAAGRQRQLAQFVPMYVHLRQHFQGTSHAHLLGWGYGKMFLNIAEESVVLGNLAEARHYIGCFWAADISIPTKAKLLKSLAGVSARLVRQYVRGNLHGNLHGKQPSPAQ